MVNTEQSLQEVEWTIWDASHASEPRPTDQTTMGGASDLEVVTVEEQNPESFNNTEVQAAIVWAVKKDVDHFENAMLMPYHAFNRALECYEVFVADTSYDLSKAVQDYLDLIPVYCPATDSELEAFNVAVVAMLDEVDMALSLEAHEPVLVAA